MIKARWLLIVVISVVFVSTQASAQGTLWRKYMEDGTKAYQQRRYADAEKSFQSALKEAEGFGQEDLRLALTLNNLAFLYQAQGKYAEAEPLYKRSLAIWEKALGPQHLHVATSLNNLALLYKTQGKYAEAEPLYKRSLAIWERTLGPEHPNVAQSLENYAALLRNMNREDEAAKMEARAKGIRAKHAQENPTK